MHAARAALCLALAGTLTAAGAASAAPPRPKPKPKPLPPVCNLVTDAAGDAALESGAPSDDGNDILGADVASDAKAFTAVIRVKNVKASGVSQLGRSLRVTFSLPGAEAPIFISHASSAYGGDVFEYGLIGKGTGGSTSPTGPAVGVVDAAKNEVRMTVSVSELSALGKAKPGNKLTDLKADARQLVGVAPNSTGVYGFSSAVVDEGVAAKPYLTGAPSCVKPGA